MPNYFLTIRLRPFTFECCARAQIKPLKKQHSLTTMPHQRVVVHAVRWSINHFLHKPNEYNRNAFYCVAQPIMYYIAKTERKIVYTGMLRILYNTYNKVKDNFSYIFFAPSQYHKTRAQLCVVDRTRAQFFFAIFCVKNLYRYCKNECVGNPYLEREEKFELLVVGILRKNHQ